MTRRVASVKQTQRLDQETIEKIGIPSCILMENAGSAVAREAVRMLSRKKTKRAVVVCGVGNNAGDGFVAARHLIDNGIPTNVFCLGRPGTLKEDAARNYSILRKLRCPPVIKKRLDKEMAGALEVADVIIDAVFGVGLNRPVEEPFLSVIEAMNASRKKIIAVDVPSGLDADTGRTYGSCVKAFVTVTFCLIKRGFLKGEGPRCVGRLVTADIGIPKRLIARI